MLKNMKKSTKSNVITLGIVVGFYVLIQILSAAGALTNSFSGQLVPICAYVIMAVSSASLFCLCPATTWPSSRWLLVRSSRTL